MDDVVIFCHCRASDRQLEGVLLTCPLGLCIQTRILLPHVMNRVCAQQGHVSQESFPRISLLWICEAVHLWRYVAVHNLLRNPHA